MSSKNDRFGYDIYNDFVVIICNMYNAGLSGQVRTPQEAPLGYNAPDCFTFRLLGHKAGYGGAYRFSGSVGYYLFSIQVKRFRYAAKHSHTR